MKCFLRRSLLKWKVEEELETSPPPAKGQAVLTDAIIPPQQKDSNKMQMSDDRSAFSDKTKSVISD